ncbi:DUF4263 domain-containing protein [Candidatus Micrarchaeota archaeon]|nr:DUF4263 domain-containing protein [Candidatus Micrarchaeota archaeon]
MTEEKKLTRWEDRYDIIKTIKVSDRSFGWMHLVLGKRKKDGELVLRLKRFRNWFMIPSEKYLKFVKKMLDLGAKELNWTNELSEEEIDRLIKKNKELAEIKEKKRSEVRLQKEINQKLLEQITVLRKQQFDLNLKQFKDDLKEFRGLLNNNKEKDIQNWLYEHPWFFGPKYMEGSKEEINRTQDRIDFMLQRYDTFYDIIELKLPGMPIFVGETEDQPQQELSRNFQMSAEVKNAISQVIGYIEQYNLDKTNMFYEKGIDLHKPKGIIIIGKSNPQIKRALKTLNSYLHDIEILSYEDVLEEANNFVKLIENRKKFPKEVN